MPNRRWTADDNRFLRLNAAIMPPDQIATALGRTTAAVRERATRKRIRLLPVAGSPDALALERDARIISRHGFGK